MSSTSEKHTSSVSSWALPAMSPKVFRSQSYNSPSSRRHDSQRGSKRPARSLVTTDMISGPLPGSLVHEPLDTDMGSIYVGPRHDSEFNAGSNEELGHQSGPSRTDLSVISTRMTSPVSTNVRTAHWSHLDYTRTVPTKHEKIRSDLYNPARSPAPQPKRSLSERIRRHVAPLPLGVRKPLAVDVASATPERQGSPSPLKEVTSAALSDEESWTNRSLLAVVVSPFPGKGTRGAKGRTRLSKRPTDSDKKKCLVLPVLAPEEWFRSRKNAPKKDTKRLFDKTPFQMVHAPDRPHGDMARREDVPSEEECKELFKELHMSYGVVDIDDEDVQTGSQKVAAPSRRQVNMDTLAMLVGLDLDAPGFQLFSEEDLSTGTKPAPRREDNPSQSVFESDSDSGDDEEWTRQDQALQAPPALGSRRQPRRRSPLMINETRSRAVMDPLASSPVVVVIAKEASSPTSIYAPASMNAHFGAGVSSSSSRGALEARWPSKDVAPGRTKASWENPVHDTAEMPVGKQGRARIESTGWWDDVVGHYLEGDEALDFI